MSDRRAPRPRVHVRAGPHGRELIVDDTFASLQRADGAATHCVWDAIAAPVLAWSGARPPRVLVLGLGGGSVARIVRALEPRAPIDGVEIDEEVVAAAREHFALDEVGVALHVGDALAYLERAVRERRRWDVIVEDVFVGSGDGVHKPAWIPEPAHALAQACLRRGGLLVTNTIDEAARVRAWLEPRFAGLLRIDLEEWDNRIFAASDRPLSARALRARIAASPVLAASLPLLRLRAVERVSASRRGTAAPSR